MQVQLNDLSEVTEHMIILIILSELRGFTVMYHKLLCDNVIKRADQTLKKINIYVCKSL
jgi:hypothetical protein